MLFQSTPPVWGATQEAVQARILYNISIHAPRVGGDSSASSTFSAIPHFNPRPPCGGRLICSRSWARRPSFQSTPPVWGATYGIPIGWEIGDISIHAPRVGGDPQQPTQPPHGDISIHAPRVGGDRLEAAPLRAELIFQSTPPVWGATASMSARCAQMGISIHAPRVGGDTLYSRTRTRIEISIHAPRVGGDELNQKTQIFPLRFQSTPPVWGATAICDALSRVIDISIHAPRVGGDADGTEAYADALVFQSTPPVWGAT